MSTRTRRALVATALAAALSLSACASPLAEPSSSPVSDDTLSLSLSRTISTIDPFVLGSPDAARVVQASVYSTLTRTAEDGTIVGDLAESWEQIDDLTWEFTLRDDAVFPDGEPFTPEDIAWNFEYLLDPETTVQAAGTVSSFLSGVSLVGDNVVRFALSRPTLDLPGRLSLIFLTTPAFYEGGKADTSAYGTGPYRIVDFDLDAGLTLERNPHYYGDAPEFATVELSILSSEASRIAALQSGDIDAALTIEPTNLPQFSGDEWTTVVTEGPRAHTLALNHAHPALADARVRQALNYGIDKEAIVTAVFGEDFSILPGQVLFEPYQEPIPGVEAYPYDPQKARELLAEAGYADGLTLELSVPAGSYVAGETVSQAIASQLAEVGVTLEITLDQNSFDRQAGDTPPDTAYIAWTTEYPDGLQWLTYYATTAPMSNVADTEYDDLLGAALAAKDRDEQRSALTAAIERYRDEADTVFLWPAPLTAVYRADLEWTPQAVILPQDIGRK